MAKIETKGVTNKGGNLNKFHDLCYMKGPKG